MRHVGCEAHGIRLPIIITGDDLPGIIVDSTLQAIKSAGAQLKEDDVIGITEAIVAKSQGNYAETKDIATDIKNKFGDKEIGLVFPIFSRNRFLNILKGVAAGAKKVFILLQYPADEVGNPIMDPIQIDDLDGELNGLVTAEKFKSLTKGFKHPFTNIDYISLYESSSPNVEVYLSNDARDILKLTKNILVAEIHKRSQTKARLLKAGAELVYTLSDVLNESVDGSGYNPEYGVLGSNLSTTTRVKLFPRDCKDFLNHVEKLFIEKLGLSPQLLIYGDGAFKDPYLGIWELADPVVSPAYSEKLGGSPNEIKLKYIADNDFSHLSGEEKQNAIINVIKNKSIENKYNEGTTPRKYADLLGSLCDLMSGSGDKGTPVILIRGYFDDLSIG
ncbi:MAG: coenzyme F420-0:L-glutamate ligase [Clostridiales bacterium]|jgi:hypothetical protein|nr:coenzyme F420-0:L-glutamate ligase [Clostridiales bacterium]